MYFGGILQQLKNRCFKEILWFFRSITPTGYLYFFVPVLTCIKLLFSSSSISIVLFSTINFSFSWASSTDFLKVESIFISSAIEVAFSIFKISLYLCLVCLSFLHFLSMITLMAWDFIDSRYCPDFIMSDILWDLDALKSLLFFITSFKFCV